MPPELLIDDSEFLTPIYVSVQKFEQVRKFQEAQHRRDRRGRFTEQATVTVGDRTITVVKPERATRAGDKLVPVNVTAFDEEFQREQDLYIGVGGKGGIGVRYPRFGQFIGENDSIEAPEVTVQDNGRVGFTNGRHRYAWLRDQGITSIPMAMTPESVANAKRYGYLSAVKKAWDESQHPRDKEGQFTGATTVHGPGSSVQLPGRYDRTKLPPKSFAVTTDHGYILATQSSSDPDYYWVNHIRVSDEHQGKGEGSALFRAAAAEAKRLGSKGLMRGDIPDRPASDAAQAVWAKLKNTFTYTDAKGFVHHVLKQEHSYGNTQIQIAPTSSAAIWLNMARDRIRDDHLQGTGKDVDPNHVTVRFGLLNDDLDGLRSFIANQTPFTAYLGAIELFPASEHSDWAVPVVAQIISPELHDIEAEIGKHADFKEKSFPVYKPHCTLAYCKPEEAEQYLNLFAPGADHSSFVVQDITISHQSGVKETIPFGMVQKWDVVFKKSTRFHNRPHWQEEKHKRHPAGSSRGGEFMSVLHGPKDALDSLLNGEKDVSIDRNDVRRFLEHAGEQHEDPDLTDLQVEGMEIFGGNGLGIERDDMPQIPPEHRQRFLEYAEKEGFKITEEKVDPLSLKPTQNQISARRVAEKLAKYEKGNKKFPSVLVSQQNRILDGHHHWGMMAAFALEFPNAKMPIFRLHVSTQQALSLMHAYMKIHGLKRATISGAKVAKDPASGRYVTPFVSFDKQGDEQLRMIASLNSSRLATWGFTAEAEVLGMARYRLTAVLDGRTSKFCRLMDGKVFDVPDARRKVIEVLEVQNPEDLKVVQPWPKQTRAAMAEFAQMTTAELTERGLHIPPYHPHCRTLLRHVPSSLGKATEPLVPTVPEGAQIFQPVTEADLKELGIEATPEQVAQWNEHIGMTPVELLSKFSGLPPRQVMTKPLGVGANPIQFDEAGINFKVRGETPRGVEFKLGALLDPFTGIYYLTQADLLAGTPTAELAFLKQMFSSFIEMGLKSSATSLALGVAGNAPYYARMGFLPDELEWDTLRMYALEGDTMIPTVLASLDPDDALLVRHLLQDKSVGAMQALVELPFSYQGRTIGEWLFGEATGTWMLDLTDDLMVAQAKAYLS